MKRAVWVLAFLAGCSGTPQGDALKVVLETTAGRAETCFVVEVLGADGAPLGDTRFPREEDRTRYVTAVKRNALPATVTLRARALIGPDCETADRPNGVSAAVEATFDPKRFVEVSLALRGADEDGDGFVATSAGGLDCDDRHDTVSPGAPEQCFGDVDHDCDGLTSCADPSCAGQPCAGPPHRLHFAEVPPSLRLGACGAVTLEVHDGEGRVTSPETGALFVPGGPFDFFLDGQCLQPLTAGALALESTVHFAVRPKQYGALTLTAASAPLIGTSATVLVQPAAPWALSFPNPEVTATAGLCSPEVVVGLVDDAGLATRAHELVALTVSADAGAPFNLYVDSACNVASSTLSLAPDAGTVSFWFTGQLAAPFTLTADAPPLQSARQGALITPAAVATVQVQPPVMPLTTSTCAGPFVVDAFDQFGNRVTPASVTVSVPDAGATVFTGVSCATVGGSDRFALTVTEEGAFTASVTADGVTTSVPITTLHAGPAGALYRWPLTVTTGARSPVNGYGGYTLLAAFDTRDAVDAGMMDADGRNLRVHFWAGDAGWRELDRLVEGPNSASTRVRFASQTDLPANGVDRRYALFSGPWASPNPPTNARSVYLFFDDFEGTTLSNWNVRGGAWQRAADRAHSGTGALKYPSEGTGDQLIEAQPALSEADVMLEAWWNTSNTGDTDFSQMVRLQPAVLSSYETDLEDNTGWNLASNNNGDWAEVVGNQSAPAQNAWMRIGLSLSGNQLRAWRDGVQIVPTSGAYTVTGTPLGAGNIGFRKHDVGGAVWLDDVSLRRYTEPEPAVGVGTAVRSP